MYCLFYYFRKETGGSSETFTYRPLYNQQLSDVANIIIVADSVSRKLTYSA